MGRIILFVFMLTSAHLVFCQSAVKRVLFIGNSYTATNNLPQMVSSVALSTNDSIIFDSNCPGGYTFEAHSTNATTLSKISDGSWDYVVLQEQSQRPSFPIGQVMTNVFPFATILDSLITTQNSCAETIFYMTWGRKNGDALNCASWPPVCTYQGMDSLLNLRYKMMADSNDAIISPVGAVWKYIREMHPIIELYNPDESHPSLAGTYAAACSFYTVIFRKDPTLISYNPGISSLDANDIRNAVKLVVFDSLLNWHVGEYDPQADFLYSQTGANQISFTNTTIHGTSYVWDFGDGNSSSDTHPIHVFPSTGTYNVTLITENCGLIDSTTIQVNISATYIETISTKTIDIYPNPSHSDIYLINNTNDVTRFTIFDTQGSIVKTGIVGDKISVIDLPSGIYFISLNSNMGISKTLKFVKSN